MLDQAWKMAAPYFTGRLRAARRSADRPRTAIAAVRQSDLVVASGGGYLADMWWWHAVGVLSLLALAQRFGTPTAMFGQGIGPIGRRALRAQVRMVGPELKVLALREDREDPATSLGVPPAAVRLSGDEAFELAVCQDVSAGRALGVNVRVAAYAQVGRSTAARVGDTVLAAAAGLQAPVVGLPVSRYAADSDLAALQALFPPGGTRAGVVLEDIASPEDLIAAVGQCRAIVTGSYHVAVFGLAQGVPAVCLTKSPYYDAKFAGLQASFPQACFVISLDEAEDPARLHSAIVQAWHVPLPDRAMARETSERLRNAGRACYAEFRAAVDRPGPVSADRQEAVL